MYVLVVEFEVEVSNCERGTLFAVTGDLFNDSGADPGMSPHKPLDEMRCTCHRIVLPAPAV